MKIQCAICKRPIDRLVRIRNEAGRKTIFRIYCHGAMEETVVPDEVLLETFGAVKDGKAFTSQFEKVVSYG